MTSLSSSPTSTFSKPFSKQSLTAQSRTPQSLALQLQRGHGAKTEKTGSENKYVWRGGVRFLRSDVPERQMNDRTQHSQGASPRNVRPGSGLTPFQLAMLRALRQREDVNTDSFPSSSASTLLSPTTERNDPIGSLPGSIKSNVTEHRKAEAEVDLQRAIQLLQGVCQTCPNRHAVNGILVGFHLLLETYFVSHDHALGP